MKRAVVGRRWARSLVGVEVFATGKPLLVGLRGGIDTILGLRSDSSWKWERLAMRSLENSLGEWVPAITGAVKRGQSAVQLLRKEGNVREADLIRASCTAAQKRVQRSVVSCCDVPCMGSGGERARG